VPALGLQGVPFVPAVPVRKTQSSSDITVEVQVPPSGPRKLSMHLFVIATNLATERLVAL
jgi:hypothetical protein